MRSATLPHHRTCGFPHPAVELSGAGPQGLMASGNRYVGGPRWTEPCASFLSLRCATRPCYLRPPSAEGRSVPVRAASARVPFDYATVTRTISGCADVSSLPAGKSAACPQIKLCHASLSSLLVLLWQLRHNSRTFALNRSMLSGAVPICRLRFSRKPRNLRSQTLPVPLLAVFTFSRRCFPIQFCIDSSVRSAAA